MALRRKPGRGHEASFFLTISLLLRPIRESGQYQVSVGITSARMIWSFSKIAFLEPRSIPSSEPLQQLRSQSFLQRACAAGIESRSGSLFIRSFEELPSVAWVHLAGVCALS
jgi:hypothetical protein